MVSEGLETWVLLSSQEQLEKEHSAWLVNFDSTAWPTRWVAEDGGIEMWINLYENGWQRCAPL